MTTTVVQYASNIGYSRLVYAAACNDVYSLLNIAMQCDWANSHQPNMCIPQVRGKKREKEKFQEKLVMFTDALMEKKDESSCVPYMKGLYYLLMNYFIFSL